MNVLESLIKNHLPLHIYNITEDSNIYCELSAYAEGLEVLRAELQTQLRECFFMTAESYGLENAERLWGNVRDDLPASRRRQMLITRSAFGYDDFTLQGMQKLLGFLGIEGVVYENPKAQRLVVDTKGTQLSQGQKNWIYSQLCSLLPCHLDIDVLWGDFCFDDIEAKNLTFDQMDSKSLTWSAIDIYEE